ncbi:MAG: cation:proton antiporter [Pseudomonadota bacterium]
MDHIGFAEIALLLAAAAIAAPLARWLKVGTVLGYLFAGILLGPYGVSGVFKAYEAKEFLHIAEFGVVLLLFLIGLELRPKRLWAMRNAIIGAGGSQMLITGAILAAVAWSLGFVWLTAIFLGLALALSSTAFALQVLEENGELTQRHGRLGFSILLFQDIAAIPLIAFAPLFAVVAVDAASAMDMTAALKAVGVLIAVILIGRFVLEHVLRLVALTKVKEAMTALALLTVVGTAAIMQWAGLSPSLGGFIAGALLAESSYRHELEADLKPFEGLLLGLFFTAVGMSLEFNLLLSEPVAILSLVVGLVVIKFAVLFAIGKTHGLDNWGSRRLGLSLSQGGEFAFVLLAAGAANAVLNDFAANLGALVVTLSMAATPLLLLLDHYLLPKPKSGSSKPDAMPEDTSGHVIIAGFGRFGQITARILRAKRIPFIALDTDPAQIQLVKSFGSEAYFGDPARMDILMAARVDEARALVLAIDDVEQSMRCATILKANFPDLPIFARARHRVHYHRLMELGITYIQRDTYLSALDVSRELLLGLGESERDADFAVKAFDEHDRHRLIDDYQHYTDDEKLRERARTDAENLARIFDDDASDEELNADLGKQDAKAIAERQSRAEADA